MRNGYLVSYTGEAGYVQTFNSARLMPARARTLDSLSLLRTFYAEGLVDNRTFLLWLVQQMATCNLAQLGFVARLADEYLEGMLVSRALTRPFLEACLGKYVEVSDQGLSMPVDWLADGL